MSVRVKVLIHPEVDTSKIVLPASGIDVPVTIASDNGGRMIGYARISRDGLNNIVADLDVDASLAVETVGRGHDWEYRPLAVSLVRQPAERKQGG